jgi:transposase-like protein
MVSYETVRRWVNHFGPMIAANLRKRRPKPYTTWHLDEVYLKIDGRMVYLWRAVDAEGEVLDVLVQTRRNKQAALRIPAKVSLSACSSPQHIQVQRHLISGRTHEPSGPRRCRHGTKPSPRRDFSDAKFPASNFR